MVYVDRSTPYMSTLASFLEKKHRLAVDAWGADDTHVKHIYQPLIDLIEAEVPDESHRQLYPFPVWRLADRVTRLSRNILLSEYLVREWAEHFKGKTHEELDELAKSFLFENCVHRSGLNKVLTENAALVKDA
jgi:hypothetical protein